MSITTSIIQEVSQPVSDDQTRNVLKWLESECEECKARQKRSGLKRRLESVDWMEIAEQKKSPNVVSEW